MARNKQVSCKICFKVMRSDNLTRHIQTQHVGTLKRKNDSEPEKTKRKRYYENDDVIKPEDENEIELEDENEIEPENEKELESEDEMVIEPEDEKEIEPEDEKEIVLQIQNNEQDSNCSETLHYCAHCNYATKRKFNMKDHIERKHAREEEIICCNNEKSHMEFIPVDEKDDLLEDSIEVWKIYQLLLKMKNK